MHTEFKIIIDASGDYTESELSEYVIFSLGFGSCSQDNPFISEDSNVEIKSIDLF